MKTFLKSILWSIAGFLIGYNTILFGRPFSLIIGWPLIILSSLLLLLGIYQFFSERNN